MYRLTILLWVLAGCSAGQPVAPVLSPTLEVLRAAPTIARIANKRLTLWPFLWRDFQPSIPPGGRPLIAVLRVTTADSTRFPADVRADSTWVLFGDQMWATAVAEELPRRENSPSLEVIAGDGPKWEPYVYVDVVIRLWDGRGRAYLLQAPHQLISITV